MRLLNVIRSLDPAHGGPGEGIRQSALATRALGHHEEVVTLDAPGAPWLAGFPAAVHALGPVRTNYGRTPSLVPWLRAEAPRYDAVIVHGLWQYHGWAVRRALAGGPVPYAVFSHGMLDPWFAGAYPAKHAKKSLYWWLAERRVLRDAAAVLFTTKEEADRASRSFRPYRVNPAVVGYGIAVDDAARAVTAEPFLRQWPETAGKRIVLFLGRLHAKKGPDLLVEAFARLVRGRGLLHLVLAGPDDGTGERARLEALVARHGLADRITFTGMLTGEAKWSALRAADVFALPSHQENFGVAVVEALALGVPVLVSERVNIWREIVEAGAGFAARDDVEGTASCLGRWLAADLTARATMRLNAEACFRRQFHASAAAARLVEALRPHIRPRRAIHGVETLTT